MLKNTQPSSLSRSGNETGKGLLGMKVDLASLFRISSCLTAKRAEILVLALLPGRRVFDNKWPDKNITVDQVVEKGRVIYRLTPTPDKNQNEGHRWYRHDVRSWPWRLRHVATVGREFYKAHQERGITHTLTFPEKVRVFKNKIDFVMPKSMNDVKNGQSAKQPAKDSSASKLRVGDKVVLKGSHTIMVITIIWMNGKATCEWHSRAGKHYKREFPLEALHKA